jgi:hypothetical protein
MVMGKKCLELPKEFHGHLIKTDLNAAVRKPGVFFMGFHGKKGLAQVLEF